MVKVTQDTDGKWRIQKEIPLALIVTVFIQTCVFVWYMASTQTSNDARLSTLEKNSSTIVTQAQSLNTQAVATARLEEKVNNIQGSIVDIKNLIQQQEPRRTR